MVQNNATYFQLCYETDGSRLKKCFFGLIIALRPQTPKHIRGGWSHSTDTSEAVDGGVGTLQL
jgi:hypothetical protein